MFNISRKKLLRLSVALTGAAAASQPNIASATQGCPSSVTVTTTTTTHGCQLVGASGDCSRCEYKCDNDLYYIWNTCGGSY